MPDCCDITFTRIKAQEPIELQGHTVETGQDFWTSDTEVEVDGKCKTLVGIFARFPGTGRFRRDRGPTHLKICNCASECWIVGSMAREPEGKQTHFVGQLITTCCECCLSIQTEPCCSPELTVSADCFELNRYDPCDPPEDELCYPRNKQVIVAFPESIVCGEGEITYYFKQTRLIVCGRDPEIIGTSPLFSFTTPPVEECNVCNISVVAEYHLLCECTLTITATPCNNGVALINPDCNGVTEYDLANPPSEVTYPHNSNAGAQMPGTIQCNGETHYFQDVTAVLCGTTIGPIRNRFLSIETPSESECGGICTISIRGRYTPIIPPGSCKDLEDRIDEVNFITEDVFKLECSETDAAGCASAPCCLGCYALLCENFAPGSFTSRSFTLPPEPLLGCSWSNAPSSETDLALCCTYGIKNASQVVISEVARVDLNVSFYWNPTTGLVTLSADLFVDFGIEYGPRVAAGDPVVCRGCPGGPTFTDHPRFDDITLGPFPDVETAVLAAIAFLNGFDWFPGEAVGHLDIVPTSAP